MQNSSQFFANLKSQAFSLHVTFTFWESTHSGDHTSLFCLKIAWVVAKLWWYKMWSFIHSRQTSINYYTSTLWDVITRGVINSVCSPLAIHTLKLYRTSLYFSPSLFITKIELFYNLHNFRSSYRWRPRNIFFAATAENINLIFALLERWESPLSIFTTINFCILLFLLKNAKSWCSELFDLLQYCSEQLSLSKGVPQGSTRFYRWPSIFNFFL